MRSFMMSALAVLFSLNPVAAQGLLHRLPKDGTFARFELETSSQDKGENKKTHKGSLTLSSVGEVKVDEKPCRWLEMKMEADTPGDHVVKVLIPSERLNAKETPLDHAAKGWRKMIGNHNDGGLRELTKQLANFKTMHAGAMPIILPGPLTDAKKLPKKKIDSKLGKLECEGQTGTRVLEPSKDYTSEVTYETWLHEKAPFGVLACRITVKTFHNGEYLRTFTMSALLVEVGKGAKSELLVDQ